ncbi:MAG: penicillin-insensitive murein endopeptidase, partial [Myxococcota bacterium]
MKLAMSVLTIDPSPRWKVGLTGAALLLMLGIGCGRDDRGPARTATTGAAPDVSVAPSSERRAAPAVTTKAPKEAAPVASRPTFPFLPDEDPTSSLSVGDTSHGYLVGGRAIVESNALKILPRQKARSLNFGAAPLVAALERAANRLYQATQTPLWIGNVAREHGGDIQWSVSHNSGRDADIAFCYVDHKGRPVDPPDLVPLNGQGFAKGQNLRFDAKRTWIVVKALLTDSEIQAQYLFISDGLKQQLLLEAARQGEPGPLRQRAAAVLRQPAGAAAHNDHLHLRIHCSKRDVAAGCIHTGAAHPWSKLHLEERTGTISRARR